MATFMEPANVEIYRRVFRKTFRHLDQVAEHARHMEYREPWEEAVRLW